MRMFNEQVDNKHKPLFFLIGAALIFLVGVLDYATGPELSFSIFYLIPISLVTWFVNRGAGILASVVSAGVWLYSDITSGQLYSSTSIPFWNAAVRLGFFIIVTLMLSILRFSQSYQKQLSQFIAQDLTLPASNILTGLQLLEKESGLSQYGRELVRLSIASNSRLITLIGTVLDLDRLSAGTALLSKQRVSIAKLFEASSRQVAALAARNETEVTYRIDPSVDAITADTELTIRVLVNLLSYAITLSPHGSPVYLSAAQHPGKTVVISVIAQGKAIPKQWRRKVFETEAQVDARKAGIGVGSGLGLVFCRQAVHAQGGKIWLDAERERGIRVNFTMPQSGS